jgi:molybdopterin converting factor small subunit
VTVARVTLLLFAAAREAAGTNRDTIEADTIGDVLAVARQRYGAEFASVLEGSRVWLDGDEPASGDATPVADGAEVAVLPPVSGGSDARIRRHAAGGG